MQNREPVLPAQWKFSSKLLLRLFFVRIDYPYLLHRNFMVVIKMITWLRF